MQKCLRKTMDGYYALCAFRDHTGIADGAGATAKRFSSTSNCVVLVILPFRMISRKLIAVLDEVSSAIPRNVVAQYNRLFHFRIASNLTWYTES